GADGLVRVFDASNRWGTLRLRGGAASVRRFEFSPDFSRIAAVGADGVIRFHDAWDGQGIGKLEAAVALNSLAFSPDGTQVAAWGAEVPLTSLDFITGRPKAPPPPLPSGTTIHLFDVRTGKETCAFRIAGWSVSPAFSPDGTWVAIGGTGPEIRV